jgi:hypothetical protein
MSAYGGYPSSRHSRLDTQQTDNMKSPETAKPLLDSRIESSQFSLKEPATAKGKAKSRKSILSVDGAIGRNQKTN